MIQKTKLNDWLLPANIVLLVIVLVLLIVLVRRKPVDQLLPFQLKFEMIETGQERLERIVREEIATNRDETLSSARQGREEISSALNTFSNSLLSRIAEIAGLQHDQLDSFSKQLSDLTQSNEQKMEAIRTTVDARLRQIQDDNATQLDQMRATVDEKLQGTLEKRLGESFKQVSERLEQVHKGLGEMQTLAAGVGDLKRVL
ncbi:MAG: DNA recombination protein RmuC, partial [Deltaproteobacteria bacterium]|nr:DNA recombination protein RmuC [Deltaproteobacteria bacterium]